MLSLFWRRKPKPLRQGLEKNPNVSLCVWVFFRLKKGLDTPKLAFKPDIPNQAYYRDSNMIKKNLGGRPSIPPYDKATKTAMFSPRQVEAIKKTITDEKVCWQEVIRELVNKHFVDGAGNEQK